MKFKDYAENTFKVPMRKPEKYKKINPKTNREKTFRKTRHLVTTIKPENRSIRNQPKYAAGFSKVRFQDWLGIEAEKQGFGQSKYNGKWYGWSHRAIHGFKVGDKVTGKSMGKKVEYPKFTSADVKAAEVAAAVDGKAAVIPIVGQPDFDNGKYEPDFTIKTDAQAKQCALNFHDEVA